MHRLTPPEGSGVPEQIQSAERWRIAGEKLRRLAPQVYENLLATLVMATLGVTDDHEEKITESYFMT